MAGESIFPELVTAVGALQVKAAHVDSFIVAFTQREGNELYSHRVQVL